MERIKARPNPRAFVFGASSPRQAAKGQRATRLRSLIDGPRHALIAALFIACAVVLGGGGSPNPGSEVILQLVFIVAALAWLWVPAQEGPAPIARSRGFWLICGLVLALPLAQLVPLPPSVWTGLAGNEDRAAALALVGREHSWQPLSHSPPRTLAALLAMIPALFAFFATASLDARGRSWVVGAVVAVALVSAMLGALQVSLGPVSGPYLYAQNSPNLTGFQANRNATADLLLIGIAATAAMLMPSLAARSAPRTEARKPLMADRRAATLVFAGLIAVLFFAVLLTASRMGIALLSFALVGVWVILRPALADRGKVRFVPALVALAAIPVAAFAAWQAGITSLRNVAGRFFIAAFDEGTRVELWRDGWFAMQQAWPFGVGMGGAQPVLIAAERLEVLDPDLPNRVHNDYLELALEGGLFAAVVLAAIAILLLLAAWRSWRDRPDERHLTALGIVVLLVIAVHSFVDYPLRSMALACLMGTGAGLLMSPPRYSAREPVA
jgi:O-antigen ligase